MKDRSLKSGSFRVRQVCTILPAACVPRLSPCLQRPFPFGPFLRTADHPCQKAALALATLSSVTTPRMAKPSSRDELRASKPVHHPGGCRHLRQSFHGLAGLLVMDLLAIPTMYVARLIIPARIPARITWHRERVVRGRNCGQNRNPAALRKVQRFQLTTDLRPSGRQFARKPPGTRLDFYQ